MVETEALKQWAVTVVLSALAGAVIQILMPKGKTERAVKIVLSLFFLCALLSPFLTGDLSFDMLDSSVKGSLPDFSEQQEKLNETVLNQTQTQTEIFICETAREYGIEEVKAEVLMDISKAGDIVIDKIKISVPVKERNRAFEYISEIEELFGVKPALDLF